MKILIQSLALACLSLSFASTGFSADGPAEKKMTKEEKKAAAWNYIAMKDGKVWVMKDGKNSELTETATLLDGTQVMKDGSYMEKPGAEKKMLKEGEAITWEGKVKDHAKLMEKMQEHKEKAAEKAADKPADTKSN